jgi:regulator of protease activity HflC (stomatin/prohibitin superfamily)
MLSFAIVAGFILLWTIMIGVAGIRTIETGYFGAVFTFGRLHDRTRKAGLTWIFPGVQKLVLFATRTHQDEFPAEPEDIEHIDEDNPRPGKKDPYRIVQKAAEMASYYRPKNLTDPDGDWEKISFDEYIGGDEAKRTAILNDELERGLTTEMPFIVEWNNVEGRIRDFIENVGDEAEVLRRLNDNIASALQDYLGPTTAAHAASEAKNWIDREIEKRLRIIIGQLPRTGGTFVDKPWGIEISRAYMKPLDPSKTVNVSRAKAAAAVADKKALVEAAEGQMKATKLAADGKEYEDEHLGLGRAKRLKAEAEAMKTEEGKLAAQLDVAREVLPEANVVFAPSDIGAIGGVLTLGAALNKGTSQTK